MDGWFRSDIKLIKKYKKDKQLKKKLKYLVGKKFI